MIEFSKITTLRVSSKKYLKCRWHFDKSIPQSSVFYLPTTEKKTAQTNLSWRIYSHPPRYPSSQDYFSKKRMVQPTQTGGLRKIIPSLNSVLKYYGNELLTKEWLLKRREGRRKLKLPRKGDRKDIISYWFQFGNERGHLSKTLWWGYND